MRMFRGHIELLTSGHRDMHDITGQVDRIVGHSGITTALAHVFNIGSTVVIGTVEYEPGLERDVPEVLYRLIPPGRGCGHE